jgi:hypothetical protein
MSVALTNLRAAIATNTLTALQQAALTQALDAIIPTFPVPDFEGVALPPPDEADAREWIAALYAIQSEGGGGGGGGVAAATIIAASAGVLSGVPTAGLAVGQPAVVQTFGAEFSLQPQDGMVVDGVTVLTSTTAGLVWERGDTIIAIQAALQTAWFVDPVAGNDESSGLNAINAVKHKAEIMRRLGTWSPVYDAIAVVITYVTSEPATGHDPGLFAPVLLNGATLIQMAALPAPSFTGTILAVTFPKNRAANQALELTFTTTTGAMAANLLLVNATRANSRAVAVRLAGGSWIISQPQNPTVPINAGGGATNDAWAAGDAITGYALVAVDIPLMGGIVSEFAAVGFSHTLYQLYLLDPEGLGSLNGIHVDGASYPFLLDCHVERALAYNGHEEFGGSAQGCSFTQRGSASGTVGAALPFTFTSGFIAGIDARAVVFQTDAMFTVASTLKDCTLLTVYVDTGVAMTLEGQTNLLAAQILYGPGSMNVKSGTFVYVGVGTAVASMPIGGGKFLNGTATGYSNATAAGLTTVHGGIALTSANLDAAAGAAGFGGFAWGGGAAISNGVQS